LVKILGKFEGASPLQKQPSPSPLKERGIKGERLINKFYGVGIIGL